MKKLIATILTLALILSLAACGAPASPSASSTPAAPGSSGPSEPVTPSTPAEDEKVERAPFSIAALKGPTAMGLVQLMKRAGTAPAGTEAEVPYQFTLAGSADQVSPQLIKGELDMACVPANLASNLYHKTNGQIVTLAINTLGVIYIVETGETLKSLKDLAGKNMVGAGKGAELGILFRSGEVMENARNTTAVILDKTGTITAGAPVVTDVLPMNGTRRDELLLIAAALESGSRHPIADAIRQFTAGMAYPELQHHTYLPGLGVQGSINEQVCAAGNAALMHRLGISVESPLAARMADEGKTPLYISRGTTLLGMIAVADAIKPDSAEAIRSMQQSGLRVIMMTGDNARTAQAVATQVGISEIRADVRPADKAAMVHRLRDEGYKVAMVGDGINDAPALTCADVGIAIGAGTDVAIESADIILLRSSLCDVVAALRLSRAIIRNIRQNLFWAFFYNILTIPLAAGVYYPLLGRTLSPGIAAAAMSLSSFCVVANALRLRRLKFGQKESATIPSPQPNTTITMNHTTVITVTGMMCPHCERHMTEALLALPGVTACTASHKENCVTIQSAETLSDELLRSAVEKAGYQYGGIKN